MKFRIRQDSFIDGIMYGPAIVEPGEGGQIRDVYEMRPLAKKGQKMVVNDLRKGRSTITLDADLLHHPGPHWEPLDDEAKLYCRSLKHAFTGEVPDVLGGLELQLSEAITAKFDHESASAMGRAFVDALKDSGLMIAPNRAQPTEHRK